MVWRRRRDSNPRWRLLPTNDLANRPLQPLGYSSALQSVITLTYLAEGEGFEPSVPLPARRFSRPLPSTTRSPFRDQMIIPVITLVTKTTFEQKQVRRLFLRHSVLIPSLLTLRLHRLLLYHQ